MAKVLKDGLTVEAPVETKNNDVPRVSILIPLPEDANSGVRIDPYEHVTINGETTLVKRGERVEVTVPVYIQLRNKFPYI